MTFVSDLEPRTLFRQFDAILATPRPSTREAAMRRHVIALAERHGLTWRTDATGNLVVVKPASPGHEAAPTVVLQSHLDMVTEKNSGVSIDFDQDPIVPVRDGDWLKADGTTLGSDNGIGVAAMLALLEAGDVTHGPLELLFTVDEETGLTGATRLDAQALELRGRRLLNLDSEDEGTVTIGCAGGAVTHLRLPLGHQPAPAGAVTVEARLSGLSGGHSGLDIHLGRGNAVQLLARAVDAAVRGRSAWLAAFSGGNKHNAIAREARAVVALAPQDRAGFAAAFAQEVAALRAELEGIEPELAGEVADAPRAAAIWTQESQERALGLLLALPHGVLAMSHAIPGLVETSCNLAAATSDDQALTVLVSTRSSVATAMTALRRKIRAAAELAGAEVEEAEGYPAWQPNVGSPLLSRFRAVHQRVTGKDAELAAVHAGLECGVLGEKLPGMDMISFGPDIKGAHSPDERVSIPSVERFYRLLQETLGDLAAA